MGNFAGVSKAFDVSPILNFCETNPAILKIIFLCSLAKYVVLIFNFGIIFNGMVFQREIGHGLLELKPNLVDFIIQPLYSGNIRVCIKSYGWFMNFGVFR